MGSQIDVTIDTTPGGMVGSRSIPTSSVGPPMPVTPPSGFIASMGPDMQPRSTSPVSSMRPMMLPTGQFPSAPAGVGGALRTGLVEAPRTGPQFSSTPAVTQVYGVPSEDGDSLRGSTQEMPAMLSQRFQAVPPSTLGPTRRDDENQALQSQLNNQVAQNESTKQELEKRIEDLEDVRSAYAQQQAEDQRRIVELQAQVTRASSATEQKHIQNSGHQEHISKLEDEVAHLKAVETFHTKQNDAHRDEIARMKRLREEDAPPPRAEKRLTLKGLEEKISQLACFIMFSICLLPAIGAIVCLMDRNYTFWIGTTWPLVVLGGCLVVLITFGITVDLLFRYAGPEHRSQFTMFFTWSTFAAFLGIILVPAALFANKHAQSVASTVSQGCLSTLPQSEILVDYSQVLYNIRLSANCTNARSVVECQGWSRNKYTDYLQYLEQDFHCGPLCPESPPPARAIVAPSMHVESLPTIRPVYEPPMFGPPVQGIKNFLQEESDAGRGLSMLQRRHDQKVASTHLGADPVRSGIMEHALPHMQARKLFDKGITRMTCFPLVATRLQVIITTFGGLWYWEGIGLIVISFLTSLYTGCYFAFSKNTPAYQTPLANPSQ